MLENGLKLILSLKTGRTLARYYFVDPLPRNPDGVGEAVLREARRVKQNIFRRCSEGAVLQPAEMASIPNESKL